MSSPPLKTAHQRATVFLIGLIALAAFPVLPHLRDPYLPVKAVALSVWVGFFLTFTFGKIGVENPKILENRATQWFILGFITFLGVGVVSALQAQVPEEALLQLTRMGLVFSIFLGVDQWLRMGPKSRHQLFKAMVPLSLLITSTGFLHYLLPLPHLLFPGLHLPSGTFFYRNLYASALFLCVPFLLINLFTPQSNIWKTFTAFTLAFTLVMMGLCRSGNTLLAMVLLFPLFLYGVNKSRSTPLPKWLTVLTHPGILWAMMFTALALVFYLRIPGKTLESRYHRIVPTYEYILPGSNSMHERAILWRKTREMIHDHRMWGVGPGNWKIAISQYGIIAKNRSYGDRYFAHPHNDWLSIFSEYGILGLIFWISLFTIVVIHGLQAFRQESERTIKIELAACLYGVLGYALISTFSYPTDRMFHPVMLMVFCALILSQGGIPVPAGRRSLIMIPALLLLLVSFLAGMEQVNTFRWIPPPKPGDPTVDLGRIHGNPALMDNKWVTVDPFTGEPLVNYAAQLNFDRREGEVQPFLEQAKTLNPWHPHVLLLDARYLEREGDPAAAEAVFLQILDRFPQYRQARQGLVDLYVKQDRLVEALTLVEQCPPESRPVELNPRPR